MGKPFDPKKPVETRNGLKARIVVTDRKYASGGVIAPMMALVTYACGDELPHWYDSNGVLFSSIAANPLSLVNIPERRSEWQRVWRQSDAVTTRWVRMERAATDNPDVIGYTEYIFEDNELIDVKFHKEILES